MMIIVSFCLLALLLALAIGLVAALLELIVRAVLTVGVAFVFALAIGISTSSEMVSGVGNGTVAFGLALIPTFYFISRMRAARSARKVRQAGNNLSSCNDFQAVANRNSASKTRRGPKASFADKALSKAWDEAMRLAPCAQLDAAREACAQFMAVSEEDGSFDMDLIGYSVFVRRHVPELVKETAELIQLVEESERLTAIARLTADLIAVGNGARNRLDAISQRLRDKLAVRRQRVASELGNGWEPFQSNQ
jgi:uncharacterized membrane protein YciS (DUF1049 family)